MTSQPPTSLRGKKRTATWVGITIAGVLLASIATVLVEHELHDLGEEHEDGHDDGDGDHAGHDDHAGHGHEGHAAGRVKLSQEAIETAGIETSVAGPGKVAATLSLPGEIRLNDEALSHVTPRIGGTVREVKKKIGDVVKKGEVMALLDSRELADITREARAAGERVKLAASSFERVEKLYKDSIASEKEYLTAKKELAEAKIDRDAAAQALAASGSTGTGSGYPLLAPFDGTIVEKHIAVGEVLKEDTRTFVIADLTKLWVQVNVFAKDLARVEVGQPARVKADGIQEAAVGKIEFITALASEMTRSATARIVLESPGPKWKAGLFVTADVAIEEIDAPVVLPDDAVLQIDGKPVVFVDEEGTFEARLVGLGRVGFSGDVQVVEIVSGLAAGDRYVSKGAFTLKAELGKGAAGHDH
jgi:cobalt-zinc-cadmium efflux system membrane fusion protein